MVLSIRSAIASDTGTLVSFIRKLAVYEKLLAQVQVTEENLARTLFCEHPKAFAILAEDAGEPVGFAIYFFNYSTFLGSHGLYIEDLYVDEAVRGKGVGMAMFRYLAGVARREQCGRMEWWVLNWNKPAIDFYEKLGAVPMDEWTVYRLDQQMIGELA